ncbi:MAG: hypothetical protein DSY37_03675 [Hyperthermus sp.]|nr:MAG: hypothetical protein DSY37_03675 [Hyperthermus sp.]
MAGSLITISPTAAANSDAPIPVPIDKSTVMQLVEDVGRLLARLKMVAEVGEGYVVFLVPRRYGFIRLGKRPVKVEYRVHRVEDTVVLIAGGGSDTLAAIINVVDVGEGAHIMVVGGGGGRLASIARDVAAGLREAIVEALIKSEPRVELRRMDNMLAAEASKHGPLVYFNSFAPLRDVFLEAAFHVTSVLGSGDYLVTVEGILQDNPYLARMVIRGTTITGAYAEAYGRTYTGEKALSKASRPPSHRVRVYAWSLSEKTPRQAGGVVFPLPVYDDGAHVVYRIFDVSRQEHGGIVNNVYIIGDSYEYLVVDPIGPEHWVDAVRGVAADAEAIKYLLLTGPGVAAGGLIEKLTSMSPRSRMVVPPQVWAQFAYSPNLPPERLEPRPAARTPLRLGETELTLISSSECVDVLTVYDPKTATLFPGPLLGMLVPPDVPRNSLMNSLRELVEAYHASFYPGCYPSEWFKQVEALEVKRIAPRHGFIIEGKRNVSVMIEAARRAGRR